MVKVALQVLPTIVEIAVFSSGKGMENGENFTCWLSAHSVLPGFKELYSRVEKEP